MSLLLLLVAAQPWKTASSLERLTRVYIAISVLATEMQLVTWLGVGSLQTLPILNAVVAVVAVFVWRKPRGRQGAAAASRPFQLSAAALGCLVLAMNATLPVKAADPYHLEKVDRIEHVGTLAYDPSTARKINVLSSVYETVLADLHQIPAVGPTVMRLHGVWSLALYLLAIGAVRELVAGAGSTNAPPDPARASWPWAVMLVVPVVFHQLVLIKNDLIIGLPALVTLAWAVTRMKDAPAVAFVWAGWLAGFAVAIKLTTLPLLIALAVALVVQRGFDRPAIGRATGGTLVGLLCGGLFYTLSANLQLYGQLMPVGDQQGINSSIHDIAISLARFLLSLIDLGLGTRVWWPGRGGWGGTFGLPFIWAFALLAWTTVRRSAAVAGTTLLVATVYLVLFGSMFPDADLAHRIALGPGLLVIAVAAHVASADRFRAWRVALAPIVVLSGVQIARSASLYFVR
jgi:hypothetical protein